MLGLGLVRQLCHPDACAHMELAEPVSSVMRATVKRKTQHHIDDYRLQVVGEGGSVPHCNWVYRCVVDIAFHLASLHHPLVAGRPPDGSLPGSHQLHEGSKVRCTLDDNDE